MHHPAPSVTEDHMAQAFARIRAGVRTLRLMDLRDRGAGQRMTAWPDVVRDFSDIWHSTLTHEAEVRRPVPTSRQISEMDEVIGWLAWLAQEEGAGTARVVWGRASGFSYRRLARKLGCSDHTVKARFLEGVYLVAARFVKK